MNNQEFKDLFRDLSTYHNRKFNGAACDTWYFRFRNRSTADVRRAFDEAKAAHRAMPTLNEVASYLPRYERPEDVPFDERPVRLTPGEVAFNLAVWPHFADLAARKISKQEFGLAFKGIVHVHHMAGAVDMDAMSEVCGIDLTNMGGLA